MNDAVASKRLKKGDPLPVENGKIGELTSSKLHQPPEEYNLGCCPRSRDAPAYPVSAVIVVITHHGAILQCHPFELVLEIEPSSVAE